MAARPDARLAAALTAQRHAIARDLHDGLAQELAFIAAQLPRLGRGGDDARLLRELQVATGRALLEARLAIDALRAADAVPLGVALRRLADAVRGRFGTEVQLALPRDLTVDAARRTALLRIAAQALANAVQHGGARAVDVTVEVAGPGVRLRVADDGAGFDPAADASGWGLVSMRERCELLGGRFRIAARPDGGGTEVTVVLP